MRRYEDHQIARVMLATAVITLATEVLKIARAMLG